MNYRDVVITRERDAIVTLVYQKQGAFGQVGGYLGCAGDLGILGRCWLELDWPGSLVDDRMDFGREAASGAARTTISPPFLPSRPAGGRER